MKNFWLETPTVICVTILKYFGLKTATVGTLRTCVRERKRCKASLLLLLVLVVLSLRRNAINALNHKKSELKIIHHVWRIKYVSLIPTFCDLMH